MPRQRIRNNMSTTSSTDSNRCTPRIPRRMSSVPLLWITIACTLVLQMPESAYVKAHPPPPAQNDIFGTVTGCATALIEMDDNQDGKLSRGEYLDFVNLLADFLCIPPRPELDLEIQTVFFTIACLCHEREGFGDDCCLGSSAAIYTKGAADGVTRTEDEDSYLRAACVLTQAILGPQQCTLAPKTLGPAAVAPVTLLVPVQASSGLTQGQEIAIIVGAVLLALLCCFLLCFLCYRDREEEEVEEVVDKEDMVVEAKSIPVDEEAVPLVADEVKLEPKAPTPPPPPPPEPEPAPAPVPAPPTPPPPPIIAPVPILQSAPPPESDEENSENIGRKMGATMDDDSEGSQHRKFRGQGELPQPPGAEGIVLRHIEVQKEAPGEYEYPERQLLEYKEKPDDDSVQEFDPYLPDGGVYDPQRPKKPPVVMTPPKYERAEKPEKEPFDPRKLRRQLGMGDGEVYEALATYEEERSSTRDNRFEWVVQGALEALAKAQESGELTRPRPKRAVSPQHMRTSPTPPPRSRHSFASRDSSS